MYNFEIMKKNWFYVNSNLSLNYAGYKINFKNLKLISVRECRKLLIKKKIKKIVDTANTNKFVMRTSDGFSNLIRWYLYIKISIFFFKIIKLEFLLKLINGVRSFNRGSFKNFNRKRTINNIPLKQTLTDYFFSPSLFNKVLKNSKWNSMEEIINHFLYYSEGPVLPSGFSQGSVEAPKGHLGVSIVSNGGNKGSRIRIRSSIQVMAGQITSLVQGVTLGDFVVIVSGSNIVVGEIDR